MKKHEFMTRLANELHSPSSVCSASLRSQLPPGEARGARKNCGESALPCKFRMQGFLPQILNRSYLKNRCTITGGAYHSVRRVAWCVRNS